MEVIMKKVNPVPEFGQKPGGYQIGFDGSSMPARACRNKKHVIPNKNQPGLFESLASPRLIDDDAPF